MRARWVICVCLLLVAQLEAGRFDGRPSSLQTNAGRRRRTADDAPDGDDSPTPTSPTTSSTAPPRNVGQYKQDDDDDDDDDDHDEDAVGEQRPVKLKVVDGGDDGQIDSSLVRDEGNSGSSSGGSSSGGGGRRSVKELTAEIKSIWISMLEKPLLASDLQQLLTPSTNQSLPLAHLELDSATLGTLGTPSRPLHTLPPPHTLPSMPATALAAVGPLGYTPRVQAGLTL